MRDAPKPNFTWQALAADLAACWIFLTRLPLPGRLSLEMPQLSQALWAFPVVGIFIGTVGGLILSGLAEMGLPYLAAAGLMLGFVAVLTGGLHEDGLADTADGFGAAGTPPRKLEIMRDSRIGTYGVLALVVTLIVKAAALAQIAQGSWLQAVGVLMAACTASRALMPWLMFATPSARTDGLSATVGQPTQTVVMRALAIGFGVALAAGWAASGLWPTLASLVVAWLAAIAVRALAMRQIGGQTGDVCGATQSVSETLMLVIFAATFH